MDPLVERLGADSASQDRIKDALARLVRSIVTSGAPFWIFAQRFMSAEPQAYAGRIWDIFPFPRIRLAQVRSGKLDGSLSVEGVLDFAKLALAALAYLHGGQRGAIDREPSPLQRTVQERVIGKVIRLHDRIRASGTACESESFAAFVDRNEKQRYPDLNADLCDTLDEIRNGGSIAIPGFSRK